MPPQRSRVSLKSEPARFQLRHLLILPALGVITLAMLACAASPSVTGTAKATATGSSTAGGSSTPPSSTLPPGAPTTPPKPPTTTPLPSNITGQYTGDYTINGSATQYPMDLKVTQSSVTLSGATNESGSTATDSGAMGSGGNFAMTETFTGHTATLQGHTISHGLAGTWSSVNGSGTWSVSQVADVSGNYDGSYTDYGSATTYPMSLSLTQVGGVLAGTTQEGSNTANDAGTIATNGVITITETFTSNGSHAYLNSSVGNGIHLEGTWNTGGSAQGTWAVNQF